MSLLGYQDRFGDLIGPSDDAGALLVEAIDSGGGLGDLRKSVLFSSPSNGKRVAIADDIKYLIYLKAICIIILLIF